MALLLVDLDIEWLRSPTRSTWRVLHQRVEETQPVGLRHCARRCFPKSDLGLVGSSELYAWLLHRCCLLSVPGRACPFHLPGHALSTPCGELSVVGVDLLWLEAQGARRYVNRWPTWESHERRHSNFSCYAAVGFFVPRGMRVLHCLCVGDGVTLALLPTGCAGAVGRRRRKRWSLQAAIKLQTLDRHLCFTPRIAIGRGSSRSQDSSS